jgi:hypothetical protein
MYSPYTLYRVQQSTPPRPAPQLAHRVRPTAWPQSHLTALFKGLVPVLVGLCGSDPHIRYRDPSSALPWQVYDPISGQRAALASEDEVRQWLEQRFYQN